MMEQQPVEFVNSKGLPIVLGNRNKSERIREAILDLQLAIDGLAAQPPDVFAHAIASFARTCSVFMRKLVLNDPRSPRLLDADMCRIMEVRFGKLRRGTGERQVLTICPAGIERGGIRLQKMNEETGAPVRTFVVPVGRQQLRFVVQWPLTGMVDWLSQPNDAHPWEIRTEGLFDSKENLDCNNWLGQQLVLFDGRGITLKEVIRVTVNTEGAHSPPLERVFVVEDSEDKTRFRAVKDGEIHILSHITICGVRYSHAIVIQCALYLYQQLYKYTYQQPAAIPVFGFSPEGAFGPDQSWLRFFGGLALTLGGAERFISFEIRAPS